MLIPRVPPRLGRVRGGQPTLPASFLPPAANGSYLSWLEMLLNVLFSDVPIEFTAATITIEIPAAMRAYSIAVAPVSSFAKHRTSFLIGNPSGIFVALADNDAALNLQPSELDN